MSQGKSPIPTDVAAMLAEAKIAAIECLTALAAAFDAFNRVRDTLWGVVPAARDQLDSREIEEFLETVQPDVEFEDYRPHVIRLYRAARNGWYPICRFWPRLLDVIGYCRSEHPHGPFIWFDEPAPVLAWWLVLKTLGHWGHNLPNGEDLFDAINSDGWPEDSELMIDDDPKKRGLVWEGMSNVFLDDRTQAKCWEYLIPAVEKAVPAIPLEVASKYTPPRYPSFPRAEPLPNRRNTLTWLREQFDEYIATLRSIVSEHNAALEQMRSAWRRSGKWTTKLKKSISEIFDKVSMPLPDIPEGLSLYVDFAERAQVLKDCQDTILRFKFVEWNQSPEGEDFKAVFSSPDRVEGEIQQAFQQVISFVEHERNRVLVRLDELENGQVTPKSPSSESEGRWKHRGPPNDRDSWHGPVRGSGKWLAEELGIDYKTLKSRNASGAIWVLPVDGKTLELWTRSPEDHTKLFSAACRRDAAKPTKMRKS